MVSHSRWYPYMYILPQPNFPTPTFPFRHIDISKPVVALGALLIYFGLTVSKNTHRYLRTNLEHYNDSIEALYSLNPPATNFFVRQLSQASSKGNIKGPLYAPLLRGIRHWTGQEAAMREASPCLAVKQILDKTTSLLEPAHVWILIPWK